MTNYSEIILAIYGITQDPVTKDYIIVLQDGYCEKCGKKFTDIDYKWCKSCLINDLKNFTSGNEKIDNLVQEMQLKINKPNDIVFEWIPYNQLNDIKEIGKNDFVTIYSAIWNGPLVYDESKYEYTRNKYKKIALKYLAYNSQNILNEFLNKV